MSWTGHYSSHNPVGHGILYVISFTSHPVDKDFHGDERVVYRSQTIHHSSHNPGGHGRLSGRSVASCPVENVFMVMRWVISVGIV